MSEEFWRNKPVGSPVADLTWESLKDALKAVQVQRSFEELHLIRSKQWCDVCGPREFWTHGHPDEVA